MMLSFKQQFSNYIGDTQNRSDLIKVYLTENAIKKLNSGKTIRLDGLSLEHLTFVQHYFFMFTN